MATIFLQSSTLTVEDDGSPVTTAATKLNFKGAGVVITEPSPDEVDVDINAGGSAIEVVDDTSGGGTTLTTDLTKWTLKGTGWSIVEPVEGEIEVTVAPGAAPVDSVFGEVGVITEADANFTAADIANAPAGDIAAVTVQAAINELDTDKAAVGHTQVYTTVDGVPTDTFLGRDTAGTGATEAMNLTVARTLLNVEDGSVAAGTAGDAHVTDDGKSHSDVVLNNAKRSYPVEDEALVDGHEATLANVAAPITTAGAALLDDANATEQRATLGLGSAAVEDAGSTIGDLVQLVNEGGNPAMPAVDGSLLTGIDAGVDTFLDLTDVGEPDYVGHAGEFVKVNAGASGLDFGAVPGGGDMLSSLNLSDVANPVTATQNLGVEVGVDVAAFGHTHEVLSNVDNTSGNGVILGRDTAGSGDSEELTPAEARTLINVTIADGLGAGTLTQLNNQVADATLHDTHTGDVTGDEALTIAAGAVTLAKMADMATASFIGRNTAATGTPEVLDAATALGVLGLDADLPTLSLPASTTISTFGASLVDDADADAASATLGLVLGTADGQIPVHDGANNLTAETFTATVGAESTEYSEYGIAPYFSRITSFTIGGVTQTGTIVDIVTLGMKSNDAALKGGDVEIWGGDALAGTSNGGDVSITGGPSAGGTDGIVELGGWNGAQYSSEVKVLAPLTTNSTIDGVDVSDLSDIANMAQDTFAGRITASTGAPEELSAAQATSMLDPFATDATTQGVVPGSNSLGASYYLNGSGAWTEPAGAVAALADLSDVTATEGTGSTVLFQGSPSITTPTIASFTNSTHDHADAAGGGQLGTTALVDDAVTYAKMQNVVADDVILGNIGGAGGIVDELTGTEVTALLDEFAKDSSTQGVVPASDNSTSKFLRADGTWVAPAGGGDLTSDGTTAQDAALFTERADHVNTPAAGLAELWVQNDTTQTPMFTDDLGSDYAILKTTSTTNNGVFTQAYTAGISNGANAETDLLYAAGELQLEHATTSSIRVSERASGPTGVAGKGHYWTRSDTPSTPMFTDDADNDHVLAPTLSKTLTIEDPVAESMFFFYTPVAITLTQVRALIQGGTSIPVTVASGTTYLTVVDTNVNAQTASNTTTGADLTIADATIAAGNVWVTFGTPTGTQTLATITIVYTED